jgi:hypothetical protein
MFCRAPGCGRAPRRSTTTRGPLRSGEQLVRSAIGQSLEVLGVPRSLHLDLRGDALDLAEIVGRQLDGGCSEVLVEAFQPPSARDRDDPGLLSEQPGERDLAWRGFFRSPIVAGRSTRARFALRVCGVKRGMVARMSELVNVVVSSIFPVRNPLPRGLNATKPMPSSSRAGPRRRRFVAGRRQRIGPAAIDRRPRCRPGGRRRCPARLPKICNRNGPPCPVPAA